MQPLYSVDHETRQNSNRIEDNASPDAVREETPLLYRFPEANMERSPSMMIAVSMLIIILVTGVVIGIYLLILQSNAENILPPVETPLQLVSRKQWRALANAEPVSTIDTTFLRKAKQVIVVQTDSEPCMSTYSCALLLQSLKTNSTENLLPYNFLVSTNGLTYEALGWHRPSPLYPEYPDSLLLAFIGNFTESPPSKLQIDEAKNFFAESVSQQHLQPNYVVFGKKTNYNPAYLFDSLKNLPQWSKQQTDA